MNFNDLLRLLRRFRYLAIVIGVLVMLAGTSLALRSPNRYASTATITADPTVVGGQSGPVGNIDFLIPQYLARLGTRKFTEEARATLPAAVKDAPIGVTSSGQPGTGIIVIQVTSTQKDAVAPWAAALSITLIKNSKNTLATLSLIDDPATPSKPYAPNRTLSLIITAIIALAVSLLSVVISAALRARRDGAAEIRERFGIRVLAEIPSLPRRIATLDPEQLSSNTRALPVVDALQTLRASVSYLLTDKPHPWLAVVSARNREGKSFVAVHLGWLLGGLENETLLVDANARHPTAHQLLGLAASPGIDELDATNLGSVMQRTAREHLGFIASGRPDRHPAEVASAHLPFLLKQIDGHDVTLIVDTPSMTGAAETVIYAAGAGAVLLVIDARRRDLADVEQTLLTLNDRGIEVLGVVINRVRRSSFRQRIASRQAIRGRNSALPSRAIPTNGQVSGHGSDEGSGDESSGHGSDEGSGDESSGLVHSHD
ncbi:MAG TPA: CpsD/CapB family tyrosine-protein kinase [Acidimicrobiia bacterium]|nr:CpsD/CapB family tyrosine-protein kinase [Acidimicrobiia bacterium]